jgi:hypothetical protein
MDSTVRRLINNDSIHFNLISAGGGVYATTEHQFRTRYIELYLDTSLRKYFKKLDTTFWMIHLEDDRTDWATNIVLYYLYDRDASEFVVYPNRSKWLRIKKIEIDEWRKRFGKGMRH